MHRILLFGKNGQIGTELTRHLSAWNTTALGKNEVDVLDNVAVTNAFKEIRPEIVINTVAYNDVDGAELYPNFAMQINASANGLLAKLSERHDALYITYSSDFVFDGRKNMPYLEVDFPNPINKYGESKLRGDLAVQETGAKSIILRTSSIYSLTRSCFLTRIIKQAENKEFIQVRSDLISCPTSAQFVAEATAFLIKSYRSELHKYSGLYNLVSSGSTSRYDWARAIRKSMNLDAKIVPIDTPQQVGALRPVYSALNNHRFQDTFDMEIPHWEIMLHELLEN